MNLGANERFVNYIEDKERKLEYLRFIYIEVKTEGFVLTCAAYGKDRLWIRETRKLFELYAASIRRDGRVDVNKIPEEHRERLARINDIIGDHLHRKYDNALKAGFENIKELTDTAFDDASVLRGIRKVN